MGSRDGKKVLFLKTSLDNRRTFCAGAGQTYPVKLNCPNESP
jgi:hypothetical protein